MVRIDGRDWLIERAEPDGERIEARLYAKPARYRLRLLHPDGREEAGAFRRYRPGAPRLGHAFATLQHGLPATWEVVDERLARDEEGEPYLDLLAQRTYGEVEELPDHELEHALAGREDALPAAAAAMLTRAEEAGLSLELAALDAGELPDWVFAEHYVGSLVLEEIEDDLLELCGVDPDRDPRETWLETVKERLNADLAAFRADTEGDHDQVEEWELRDGRVFAAAGNADDEGDPESGYGWMCRLIDASALGAAGFERVRKAQLQP